MITEQVTQKVSTPFYTYPEMVKCFNMIRKGRFITDVKLREIHKNNFGTPSEIVLKNFIKRSMERFTIPPIKREDGIMIKIRNIMKNEIPHLAMSERVHEILGNKKI